MEITFWGAAQTVTGSMHAVETASEVHLLDCGLVQGHRREAFALNSQLPFPANSIRSVVLSHAHLDHSGNLPTLVRHGFNGRIHTTSATAELCCYMLADSAHLQEKDAAFIEKRIARRKRLGIADRNTSVPPLYTMVDAENAVKYFEPSEFNKAKRIGEGLNVRFGHAGHILWICVYSSRIYSKRHGHPGLVFR